MEKNEVPVVHNAGYDPRDIDGTAEDARLDRDLDAELAQLIEHVSAPPQRRATGDGDSVKSSQKENRKDFHLKAFVQGSAPGNSRDTTYDVCRCRSKEGNSGAVQSKSFTSIAKASAGHDEVPTQKYQSSVVPLDIPPAAKNWKRAQTTAGKLTASPVAAKKPSRIRKPSGVSGSASLLSASARGKSAFPDSSTPASSLSKTRISYCLSALPKATSNTAALRRKRLVAEDSSPAVKGTAKGALNLARGPNSAVAAKTPAAALAGLGSPAFAAVVPAIAAAFNRKGEAVAPTVVRSRASKQRTTLSEKCITIGKGRLADDRDRKCDQATAESAPAPGHVAREGAGKLVRPLTKNSPSVIVPPIKIPRKVGRRLKGEGSATPMHGSSGSGDLDIRCRTYAPDRRRDPRHDPRHILLKRKQAEERQQNVRQMQRRAEPNSTNINFRLRLTFSPQSLCPPLEIENTAIRTPDGGCRLLVQAANDARRNRTSRGNWTKDKHQTRSNEACSTTHSCPRTTRVRRGKKRRSGILSAPGTEPASRKQPILKTWSSKNMMFPARGQEEKRVRFIERRLDHINREGGRGFLPEMGDSGVHDGHYHTHSRLKSKRRVEEKGEIVISGRLDATGSLRWHAPDALRNDIAS